MSMIINSLNSDVAFLVSNVFASSEYSFYLIGLFRSVEKPKKVIFVIFIKSNV